MTSLTVEILRTRVQKSGICYICQDDQQLTSNRSPCECQSYVHWDHLQQLCKYSLQNRKNPNYKKCGICKIPLNVIWIRSKPSIRQFVLDKQNSIFCNIKFMFEYSLRFCYSNNSVKFYKNPVFWIHLFSFVCFNLCDYWVHVRNHPMPETGEISTVLPIAEDAYSSNLL